MDQSDILNGINSFIDRCADIKKSDLVLICYSTDAVEAVAWLQLVLDSRRIENHTILISNSNPSRFLTDLFSQTPQSLKADQNLVIITLERHTISFADVLDEVSQKYPAEKCKIFRAMSASPELFATALSVCPDMVEKKNNSLLSFMASDTDFSIKCPGGTNLQVSFDHEKYVWISNRGKWKPGRMVLLPAGEIATYPASISGELIADFAFFVNSMESVDPRLGEHPVRIRVEENKFVDFQCNNAKISQFISEQICKENARKVGEFGLGTNFGVKDPLDFNCQINERRVGVHIGFGQHNQPSEILEYSSPVHFDFIAREGILTAQTSGETYDMKMLYDTKVVKPSISSKTASAIFVDGNSDCCGQRVVGDMKIMR